MTAAAAAARPLRLAVGVHNRVNFSLGDCLDGKANDLQMGGLWGHARPARRPTTHRPPPLQYLTRAAGLLPHCRAYM